MKGKKISVLFADDSALMRREIRRIIESDPELEICQVTRNGAEALEAVKVFNPDVVVLDINMPVMDGLTALQMIMMESPRPVIMLSSLTQQGAIVTYEALELGAVDFIPKPGGTVSANIDVVARDIIYKIKAAASSSLDRQRSARQRRSSRPLRSRSERPATRVSGRGNGKIVVIGQSTGGPNTILEVLPHIPADLPASIIIVQHMPGTFTPGFAKRLDNNCALPFREAQRGEIITPGEGYLAPGDLHMVLSPRAEGHAGCIVRLTQYPEGTLHTPSVDVTMLSVLEHYGAKTIGVLLTGMGADGAEAMVRIRQAGGRTIAESEETAIVFGMPKEAIRLGGAEFVLPAHEIGKKIVKLVLE